MWIFLKDSFLSIVDPKGAYEGGTGPQSVNLLVRARIAGDIEAVFPAAEVTETPDRDYRFRALINRHEVAGAMHAEVMELDCGNFKGSVRDKARHDAYAGVWGVMHREQERRLRPAIRRPQRDLWHGHDDPEHGRFNRRR